MQDKENPAFRILHLASRITMKLLIDLYKTKDLYSGLGQYSLNFANEMMKYCPYSIEPVFLIPSGFNSPRNP
ncbi:MAG: hypothetical protein NTW31_09840, partial [Bacteroidetes bacterium]|nr:hypothetical protein [Bacteroidota bacterium]